MVSTGSHPIFTKCFRPKNVDTTWHPDMRVAYTHTWFVLDGDVGNWVLLD